MKVKIRAFNVDVGAYAPLYNVGACAIQACDKIGDSNESIQGDCYC